MNFKYDVFSRHNIENDTLKRRLFNAFITTTYQEYLNGLHTGSGSKRTLFWLSFTNDVGHRKR